MIPRDLLFHPYDTFRQVARYHGVGPKAVQKVAASHFLYRFVSKKKPFLTPKARRDRIKWIEKTKVDDWTSMIWTDESMVRIGDKGRR